VLFGRHATPLAPPHPSQNPRRMTRVHRAINSGFFLVRCDRVSYFLSFTAVGSASILRIISAQRHVQRAMCKCVFIVGSRRRDLARPSSERLYCPAASFSGVHGGPTREAHGEMVRNDGLVDHVDIT